MGRQAGRTVKTEQCSQTLHIVMQVSREETNETSRYEYIVQEARRFCKENNKYQED
jgi:hypothetical protein